MFEWVRADYVRPLLVACLLLALAFLATGLVLRFVAVSNTQVDTPTASNTDQISEADASYAIDVPALPGLGRADQAATGEGEGGSKIPSIDVDVPHLARSDTPIMRIRNSSPGASTAARPIAQPSPLPTSDDGFLAFTASADSNLHTLANDDGGIASATSHSGFRGAASEADAPDGTDGTSNRDERSLRHVDPSGGGSFAARLRHRIKGIANATTISIEVGGTEQPAHETRERHNGTGGGDVWSGISRAQPDLGASLARFATDPSEGSTWTEFQAPSPNRKSPWSDTGFDNLSRIAALRLPVPQVANDATGAPTISGVAQVGHELTASTTGISDPDGKTMAEAGDTGYAYTYQWVRVDGANETDISGATSKTYTLVGADAGKTLKVKASFVDDADNDEGPLTSAATATVVVPEVTIVADSSSALYRIDNVSFTLTRTESTANELTVRVNLTQDRQFLAAWRRSRNVTFEAGSATATLEIEYWHFEIPFGEVVQNGTLTASVTDRTHYDVGTPASATMSMIIPVTFTLVVSNSTVSEESGDKAVATLIVRTGEGAPVPESRISLAVVTESGTAQSDDDYRPPVSSVFVIDPDDFTADGSVYKVERTVEVPIVNDNVPDSGETFDLSLEPMLSLPGKYWLNFVDSEGRRCIRPNSCFFGITITDDDPEKYIETLEIVSSPANNAYYETGETVTVEATYMDPVTVTPSGTAPTLDLIIGDNTRAAAYTGTSSDGKTLSFSYTVVAQDHDPDGISGDGGSIVLNGGTIVEQATGEAANLRLPEIRADPGQRVNKDAEIVYRGVVVTSTPVARSDTYGAGETIRIAVTFDLPVIVSGTPRLLFEIGHYDTELDEYVSRDEYLTYVRGSGTRTLVFEYVVQPDDEDPDGIRVSYDSLETNGGTIRRPETGRDAILDHYSLGFLGTLSQHKVDGSLMPTIAKLTGLTLSDATLRPRFEPDTTLYTAGVANFVAATTVTATAETGIDVTILPADSDNLTEGHQVALEGGRNEITVTASQAGSASQIYTVVVTRAVPATGAPTISGRVQVDQVLTASTAGISDVNGKTRADTDAVDGSYGYRYRWVLVDGANESDIPGATSKTYMPVPEDEGKSLKVRVTFRDDAGYYEGPLISEATVAVAAASNATGSPLILGRVQVGQDLLAWTSTISDKDGKRNAERGAEGYAYTYQWLRVVGGNESEIVGATSKTYRPVAEDVGKSLKVRVFFVDDADNPEGPLTSGATAAVTAAGNATGAPTIAGRAQVGQELTALTAGISDPDGKTKAERGAVGHAYRYEWVRVDGVNESNIFGAWWKTYTPVAEDVGKSLKVRVSFGDDAGNPEGPLISAATATVTAANGPATGAPAVGPDATGAPTISGRPEVGQVLTASTAGISDTDGKTKAENGDTGYAYTYQWLRVVGGSESDIAGATSKTYTVMAADEGKSLKVRVAFVDDADNPEGPLTSASTAAVVVRGAPALSVLDAEVEETEDAVLAFPVRLDGVASTVVTVRYATADGTAVEGFDYTAANGILTFALGETQKTVSVPVHDDAHDEGDETLTLTLSDASGALITDGLATGTILANSDPIPGAWHVRFGRAVAHQILDAVDERLGGRPSQGIEVRIAGRRFSGASLGQVASEEETSESGLDGLPDWLRGDGDEEGTVRFDSQKISTSDLVTGHSIVLTKDTREGGFISLWSQGALTHFNAREGDLTLKGEVASAMVGAGWTQGARTAGLIIAYSRGEGTYRSPEQQSSHDIASTVSGVFPYGRYSVNERLSLWGVVGYGAGTQTIAPEGEASIELDFDMKLAAAGIRGELLTPAENDGVEIALKSDAMVVNTKTEALPGAPSGAEGYITRFGLGLEGRWHNRDEDDGWLEPIVEIGGRYDGGDAETGFGIDVGAGLSWTDRDLGLEAEIRARGLLDLDDKRLSERGFAGSLSWVSDPLSNLGPSLSLSQTAGASATGGAESLLARDTLAGLAIDEGANLSRQFEARLGYGHPVPGDRFTGTAELGLRLSDAHREYALGWHLLPERRERDSLELRLEATRRESIEGEREPEHGVRIDLINRW